MSDANKYRWGHGWAPPGQEHTTWAGESQSPFGRGSWQQPKARNRENVTGQGWKGGPGKGSHVPGWVKPRWLQGVTSGSEDWEVQSQLSQASDVSLAPQGWGGRGPKSATLPSKVEPGSKLSARALAATAAYRARAGDDGSRAPGDWLNSKRDPYAFDDADGADAASDGMAMGEEASSSSSAAQLPFQRGMPVVDDNFPVSGTPRTAGEGRRGAGKRNPQKVKERRLKRVDRWNEKQAGADLMRQAAEAEGWRPRKGDAATWWPGDWLCPECRRHNFSKNAVCRITGCDGKNPNDDEDKRHAAAQSRMEDYLQDPAEEVVLTMAEHSGEVVMTGTIAPISPKQEPKGTTESEGLRTPPEEGAPPAADGSESSGSGIRSFEKSQAAKKAKMKKDDEDNNNNDEWDAFAEDEPEVEAGDAPRPQKWTKTSHGVYRTARADGAGAPSTGMAKFKKELTQKLHEVVAKRKADPKRRWGKTKSVPRGTPHEEAAASRDGLPADLEV